MKRSRAPRGLIPGSLLVASLVLAGGSPAFAQAARDHISIVGSSTVYPFATVVAEQLGRTSRFKTPKIESTGTGGGFKLFCGGVGVKYPDISNASRAMKPSEQADCAAHGVRDIVEFVIGYDGIVLAQSAASPRMALTLRDIYLALAAQVPAQDGTAKLIANPYRTWKDVNPRLPAEPIEVLGPPPTSGTRDAFVELAMEGGCQTFPWIKAMKATDEDSFKQACYRMREDGRFIEAGENDNLIVQKLKANKAAVGIFGYSYLEQNEDAIKGIPVDGEAPTFENIADSKYPISRPLFFYVKKAHIGSIPGIAEYVAEFTSKRAMGEDGYLADRGLVPLPPAEFRKMADRAAALQK